MISSWSVLFICVLGKAFRDFNHLGCTILSHMEGTVLFLLLASPDPCAEFARPVQSWQKRFLRGCWCQSCSSAFTFDYIPWLHEGLHDAWTYEGLHGCFQLQSFELRCSVPFSDPQHCSFVAFAQNAKARLDRSSTEALQLLHTAFPCCVCKTNIWVTTKAPSQRDSA